MSVLSPAAIDSLFGVAPAPVPASPPAVSPPVATPRLVTAACEALAYEALTVASAVDRGQVRSAELPEVLELLGEARAALAGFRRD